MVRKRQTALTASLEDYLETIYRLEQDHPVARARDVAKGLGVGKSSVTTALKVLAEKGYLTHSPYQNIVLTEAGRVAAREILRRHEILQDFLERILDIPTKRAEASACRMEHAVTSEDLERLMQFVEFFTACPRGRDLLDEFRRVCREGLDPSRCHDCVAAGLGRLQQSDTAPHRTLATLEPGERGVVLRIMGDKRFHKRVTDMGVTRGAVVEVERVAPMGDPMQIRVRGYHLSIRKVDAASIIIDASLPQEG